MADSAITLPQPGHLASIDTSGASWIGRRLDGIAPDRPYEGALVGEKNGAAVAYGASSDIDAVPPIEPAANSYGASHREAAGDIIYVNGIDTPWHDAYADAKQLADQTGQPVVNVHVATSAIGHSGWSGTPVDGIDALANRDGYALGQAPKTLASAILERLDKHEPVHVVAHSKGAIVTSAALDDVRSALVKRGESPAQAQADLGKVQVETFGGAAPSFPDGPQYVHYINRDDPVAEDLGLGTKHAHPGAGATTLQFDGGHFGWQDLDPAADHHFAGPYLTDERVPFALARTLGANQPDEIVSYIQDVAKRPNAHPKALVAGH